MGGSGPPLPSLSAQNLKMTYFPWPPCQKSYFVAVQLQKKTFPEEILYFETSYWKWKVWKRKKKEQFRPKCCKKYVAFKKNGNILPILQIYLDVVRKNQKLADPPPLGGVTKYVYGSLCLKKIFLFLFVSFSDFTYLYTFSICFLQSDH